MQKSNKNFQVGIHALTTDLDTASNVIPAVFNAGVLLISSFIPSVNTPESMEFVSVFMSVSFFIETIVTITVSFESAETVSELLISSFTDETGTPSDLDTATVKSFLRDSKLLSDTPSMVISVVISYALSSSVPGMDKIY